MKKLIAFLVSVSPFAFGVGGEGPFYWGVSNSAFQVEGSPADSDWRRWTQQQGKIRDGSNADRATDFWNRYEEDFRLARDAGLTMFRLSVAWDRIEPEPGQWDEGALAHYEKILTSLRDHGLEPVVTLHHYVLPAWMAHQGGLLAAEFPDRFARYAEKVVDRLSQGSPQVAYWMTFNEPEIWLRNAYLAGEYPPGLKDPKKAMEGAAQMARAHIRAVGRIRRLGRPHVKVSIAKNWQYHEVGDGTWLASWGVKVMDWVSNHQFMKALTTGRFFFWMPGSSVVRGSEPLPEGKSTLDYIGINNYGRWLVRAKKSPPFFELYEGDLTPKTDMGWEIYPRALYEGIRKASAYGLPILVSENGVADAKDTVRPDFIRAHLDWVQLARSEGYPVFGYLYWSLTDNFEWSHGLTPKFGLVEVDYTTLKRTPRPSYDFYRSYIVNLRRGQ